MMPNVSGPRSVANAGILGGLLLFLVMGYINPFFTLYVNELGRSNSDIGFLVMIRGLAAIIIALPAGHLIDKTGVFRVLGIGLVGMTASFLLLLISPHWWALGLSQIFYGISTTILVTSLQVLVSKGNRDTRNKAIKRYAMWVSVGTMAGPLLGGAIVAFSANTIAGYENAFLFSAAWSGLGLLALWILHRHKGVVNNAVSAIDSKPKPNKPKSSYAQLFSGSRDLLKIKAVQAGLIITFIIMYIQGLYISFVPVFFHQNGYSTQWIAISLAAYGFGGLSARVLIPWLSERLGLMALLLMAGTIASAGILLMPLSAISPASGLILMLITGGAVGLNLPISIMLMVDWVKGSDHGKLMGWRLLINRTAQMSSPMLFGLLGQGLGLSLAFVISGGLLMVAMAGFLVVIRRTPVDAPVL